MRIAVPYDQGQIVEHLGHARQFKLYDVLDDHIHAEQIVDVEGGGHGATAAFLLAKGTDTVLCGGAGCCSQRALDQAGVRVCAGVSGDADQQVRHFLATAGSTLSKPPMIYADGRYQGILGLNR